MHKLLYKFLLTPLVLVSLQCGATGVLGSAPLPRKEVDAVNSLVVRLKKPWEDNINISANDCGVKFKNEINCTCNLTNCQVTEIYFPSHDLRGRIPAEIGNLTSLRSLNLRYNRLHGSIPETFKALTSLVVLNLGENYLEGPIPTFLGELKSLQEIVLFSNWFSHSIPPGLGALPSLKSLILSSNLLSGPIPVQLGSISSLETLNLMDNLLSHRLPDQLGNLKNLQYLYLVNNEFTGELPSSFEKLENLLIFDIRGNNFSGTIPNYIAKWKKLHRLMLMGNNFEGPFPTAISTLTKLTFLAVNDLSVGARGGSGLSFPEISGMKFLQHLTLRNCSLAHEIPGFIWHLQSLSYLDLSFNNLTGKIPDAIKQPFLRYIFLKRNKFNEPLPKWLTKYRHLYVDVSENNFTSETIPQRNISKNWNLFSCCSDRSNVSEKWQEADFKCYNETLSTDHIYINCGGEQISINNSNYEADLQPEGASTFFLSANKTWAYSSMGTFIGISRGQYITNRTCNISMADAPLYMNARISPISLKYYGFCLKDDTYVVKLHFAEITWQDTKDPSSKGKRVFDVEIQGEKKLRNFNIAEAARGVNKNITMEFNVTVNNSRLEIHLYWTGKGSTFGPSKYYGPLISAISVTPVPKRIPSSRKQLSVVSISGIVGSAFLFLIFVLLLFWMLGWFGGNELRFVGIYDFHQIKAATNNFNEENKIGEGGFGPVYKGKLPNGTFIAVKVLSGKSKQGNREFANEISTIFDLKHEHLVELLGSFAQANHILLVYEYMENKSLEHALFGSEELRERLDWPTRVKICLGIAKGLTFLHEESQKKIIHTDIKPKKILLDKNLKAKISDFGFAKLYEEGKTVGIPAGNIEGKMPGTTAIDDEGKTPGIKIPSTTVVDVEGRAPSTIAVDDEGKTPGPTNVADVDGKTLATTTLDDEGKRPGTIIIDDEGKTHVARKTKVITPVGGGTTTYMAPEYVTDGHLSSKVDVYSFGIVTLQIFSGQESVTTRTDGQRVYLLERAGVLEQKNNLVALVDPTLRSKSDYNREEAETILKLAMMCINQFSSLRPIMSQVVQVLERNKDISTLRDELGYAKVVPSFSQSSQSGSTSQEGTSVPTMSHSVSKETGEQSGIPEISDIKASG